MRIAVVGRGNLGGGLAGLWQQAGHHVTLFGRDGGDASDADVVVVAVPSTQIAAALVGVSGIAGKVTIDTTNPVRGRNEEFESLAHEVRSIVGGPTAKAFNTNFASIHGEIAAQRVRPSNLYAADDDAREVVEQLSRDAGYEPVSVGGLDKARLLEENLALLFAVRDATGGPVFYRFAEPGRL
jgi:8-hydroxy-5-deazaflavin:NADPH oxidoreductase